MPSKSLWEVRFWDMVPSVGIWSLWFLKTSSELNPEIRASQTSMCIQFPGELIELQGSDSVLLGWGLRLDISNNSQGLGCTPGVAGAWAICRIKHHDIGEAFPQSGGLNTGCF